MKNYKLDISITHKEFDKSLLPIVKQAVQAVFDQVAEIEKSSLSILICGDEKIRELNKTYRGIDRVTDVLSFPSDEQDPETNELFIGDVVISYPTAVKQADKFQHSVSQELALLSVHGVLHLMGYDHSTIEDEKIMWQLQKNILNSIGYISDLLSGESYAQE